jgi:hypothetical protein
VNTEISSDRLPGGRSLPVIETVSNADRVLDTNVRQFLALWFAEADAGRRPGKDFLDPLRLRFLLGSLSLLDVEKDPLRFRYRLVGTDVVQRLGLELTGKWLDDHPVPAIRPLLVQGARMVYHTGRPVYGRLDTRALGQDWQLEVVAVPLFAPDGSVGWIGAGQTFPPDKIERQPGQRDS